MQLSIFEKYIINVDDIQIFTDYLKGLKEGYSDLGTLISSLGL